MNLMQIGIIGGTGRMGRGLALRLVKNHDIYIGSRFIDRAIKTSNELTEIARGFYRDNMKGKVKGELNHNVIKNSEIILVTLPFSTTTQLLSELKMYFNSQQIVVSPVVPMKKKEKIFVYTPIPIEKTDSNETKSAAELIQDVIKPTQVVSAFHTVPAAYMNNLDAALNIDVFISSDYESASKKVARLICEIPNLRPLIIGPLCNSRLIESLTPLLLNTAILNNLVDPSIRIVPWLPTSYETCERITS